MSLAADRLPPGAETLSRRTAIGRLAAVGGMISLGSVAGVRGDDRTGAGLIVRSRRPLDLESPPSALDHWLTPNDLFFVRSHFGAPVVTLGPWEVEVGGMVDRPARLHLADWDGLERVTVPAVLQCSGNGRGLYRPGVPGVPWERGAVGHAEWSGVRLADVLRRAGVRAGAGHVHLLGADGPPSPKTPPFFRSIPLERALDPSTILATEMNGEPLPVLHGGPVRLVLPGWAGNHWMKWLRRITVSREEAPGFFMQTAYKMPRVPAPPGASLKPSDMASITVMNVKSLITWPSPDERVSSGRHEVRGVAWTGAGHVTKLELATDRDPVWRPAALIDPPKEGSWRRWRAVWNASQTGRHVLRVRATDSNGQTQPEKPAWNRSGYLWNGIDQATCEVV